LVTENKKGVVKEIEEKLKKAKCIIFVENKGLKVEETNELRTKLREIGDNDYKVYKNRLVKVALKDIHLPEEEVDKYLSGPNCISFAYGDPTGAAKILAEFAKTHDRILIKGGILEGKSLTPAKVQQIAQLPSKEVLISKMMGSLNTPATNIVGCISAVMRNLVYAIEAVRKKKEEAGQSAS